MDKLVVGLGNPGAQYKGTRHNIAWNVLEKLEIYPQLRWTEKFKGVYASCPWGDGKAYFLRPQTYMNLSGESVQPLMAFFKIGPSDTLIVHDELDLPYGTLALKKGGGLAGNNGLRSIAQSLGTQDFLRLRMGIGKPVHGSVSDWVLGQFNKEEQISLGDFVTEGAHAIELFLNQGFDKAASRYSRKSVLKPVPS